MWFPIESMSRNKIDSKLSDLLSISIVLPDHQQQCNAIVPFLEPDQNVADFRQEKKNKCVNHGMIFHTKSLLEEFKKKTETDNAPCSVSIFCRFLVEYCNSTKTNWMDSICSYAVSQFGENDMKTLNICLHYGDDYETNIQLNGNRNGNGNEFNEITDRESEIQLTLSLMSPNKFSGLKFAPSMDLFLFFAQLMDVTDESQTSSKPKITELVVKIENTVVTWRFRQIKDGKLGDRKKFIDSQRIDAFSKNLLSVTSRQTVASPVNRAKQVKKAEIAKNKKRKINDAQMGVESFQKKKARLVVDANDERKDEKAPIKTVENLKSPLNAELTMKGTKGEKPTIETVENHKSPLNAKRTMKGTKGEKPSIDTVENHKFPLNAELTMKGTKGEKPSIESVESHKSPLNAKRTMKGTNDEKPSIESVENHKSPLNAELTMKGTKGEKPSIESVENHRSPPNEEVIQKGAQNEKPSIESVEKTKSPLNREITLKGILKNNNTQNMMEVNNDKQPHQDNNYLKDNKSGQELQEQKKDEPMEVAKQETKNSSLNDNDNFHDAVQSIGSYSSSNEPINSVNNGEETRKEQKNDKNNDSLLNTVVEVTTNNPQAKNEIIKPNKDAIPINNNGVEFEISTEIIEDVEIKDKELTSSKEAPNLNNSVENKKMKRRIPLLDPNKQIVIIPQKAPDTSKTPRMNGSLLWNGGAEDSPHSSALNSDAKKIIVSFFRY